MYSNDMSDEAKHIINNNVEISRIDSFFYHSAHEFDYNWVSVARSLLRYKNEEAIILFKTMLNDDRVEFQNYAIFPLINAEQFDIAFTKFKELVSNNEIIILQNLYHSGDHSDFSDKKFVLFKKHKDKFIPFFKEICFEDSISYEIKFRIADLLYYLGEEEEIILICEEILEKLPEPNTSWKDHTPEDSMNSNLRYYAHQKLKDLKKNK